MSNISGRFENCGRCRRVTRHVVTSWRDLPDSHQPSALDSVSGLLEPFRSMPWTLAPNGSEPASARHFSAGVPMHVFEAELHSPSVRPRTASPTAAPRTTWLTGSTAWAQIWSGAIRPGSESASGSGTASSFGFGPRGFGLLDALSIHHRWGLAVPCDAVRPRRQRCTGAPGPAMSESSTASARSFRPRAPVPSSTASGLSLLHPTGLRSSH